MLANHPSLNDTQQSAEPPAGARGWYTVFLLLCLYILSFFGRQIISLLVEPIEKSLGLTEVQIGLLIGFSFTMVYAVGGLAFGWFVDTFPRKRIIFVGTIVWGLSCIGCGLSTSFGWLFVARMGVGIGEATLMPAAYALLSDIFPRRRLGTALGIFSFGATFGIAMSLCLGGYLLTLFAHSSGIETPLGHLDPWQAAFVISGCPPLIFGLLALTLPEPTRKKRVFGLPPAVTPLLTMLRRRQGIMVAQFAGFSMNALMGYTLMAWAPAFMARTYGWRAGEIGPALALALGVSGAIATLGSGYLADRMWARGVKGSHYILAASALAISSPFGAVAFLSPSPWIFLVGVFVVYFAAAVGLNMGATSLQLLTPPALRGRLSGLYLFCTNMIGAGLGPLIVATLTQHLFHDRAKVGVAMAIVIPTAAMTGAIILGLSWRRYAKLITAAADSIDEGESVDIAAPMQVAKVLKESN